MSKYTKVIAALGVAAGLGVASLPFGAYADIAPTAAHTGAVDVQLTVPDSLTVKIDNNEINSATTVKGTAIDLGEIIAGTSKTSDTSKTSITVSTNMPNGYTLTAVGTDLTNTNTNITENNKIVPFTTATKVEDGGNEGWGIRVSATEITAANAALDQTPTARTISGGIVSSVDKFAASDADTFYMPTSAEVVDQFAAGSIKEDTNYAYEITYGANVGANKPSGIYTGTATYVVTGVANS